MQEQTADLALRSGNNGLNDSSTIVIEQVDLIDDEQADSCGDTDISALARDDIPLLGCGHDHLGLHHLVLAQLHVTCQLLHRQPCMPPQSYIGVGARGVRAYACAGGKGGGFPFVPDKQTT